MFETTRALANLVFSGRKQRFADIRIIGTHGNRIKRFSAFGGIGDRDKRIISANVESHLRRFAAAQGPAMSSP